MLHIVRYLERRRTVKSESPDADYAMESKDKIRSMIDVTYTVKKSDTFSKFTENFIFGLTFGAMFKEIQVVKIYQLTLPISSSEKAVDNEWDELIVYSFLKNESVI